MEFLQICLTRVEDSCGIDYERNVYELGENQILVEIYCNFKTYEH